MNNTVRIREEKRLQQSSTKGKELLVIVIPKNNQSRQLCIGDHLGEDK